MASEVCSSAAANAKFTCVALSRGSGWVEEKDELDNNTGMSHIVALHSRGNENTDKTESDGEGTTPSLPPRFTAKELDSRMQRSVTQI